MRREEKRRETKRREEKRKGERRRGEKKREKERDKEENREEKRREEEGERYLLLSNISLLRKNVRTFSLCDSVASTAGMPLSSFSSSFCITMSASVFSMRISLHVFVWNGRREKNIYNDVY